MDSRFSSLGLEELGKVSLCLHRQLSLPAYLLRHKACVSFHVGCLIVMLTWTAFWFKTKLLFKNILKCKHGDTQIISAITLYWHKVSGHWLGWFRTQYHVGITWKFVKFDTWILHRQKTCAADVNVRVPPAYEGLALMSTETMACTGKPWLLRERVTLSMSFPYQTLRPSER